MIQITKYLTMDFCHTRLVKTRTYKLFSITACESSLFKNRFEYSIGFISDLTIYNLISFSLKNVYCIIYSRIFHTSYKMKVTYPQKHVPL